MTAIQEPYEISVWEDKYNQSTQKYEEHKVAIIGTDTFKAQCSALEPVLTKNINGTSTFTFKMLRECYDLDIIESLYGYRVQNSDENENEDKALAVQPDTTPLIYQRIQVYDDHYINPFIQYLFNEQKLKVKWKGKWYDFIIKNCDESSDSKLITYTCEDQFISELSRQGFNLIYDIELQNNIDTAPNLVTDVLKGTDWSYDAQNSDTIREYVEEPVYEADLPITDNYLSFELGVNELNWNIEKKSVPDEGIQFEFRFCKPGTGTSDYYSYYVTLYKDGWEHNGIGFDNIYVLKVVKSLKNVIQYRILNWNNSFANIDYIRQYQNQDSQVNNKKGTIAAKRNLVNSIYTLLGGSAIVTENLYVTNRNFLFVVGDISNITTGSNRDWLPGYYDYFNREPCVVKAILENQSTPIDLTLNYTGKLFPFYSQVSNLFITDETEVKFPTLQLYYVDGVPIVEKDGMLIINGTQCYIENIVATKDTTYNFWVFHKPVSGSQQIQKLFTLDVDALVSTQYRAQRIVNHIKSKCDPLTNRVCQIWKFETSNDEIYRFTDTETLDCTAVNNLIVNPEQFTDSMNWYFFRRNTNKSQPAIGYAVLQDGYAQRTWLRQSSDSADYGGLALLPSADPSSRQYLYNTTLQGAATYFPNGLVKGNKYIVSYELLVTNEEIEELNNILEQDNRAPLEPHIYIYQDSGDLIQNINTNDFLKINSVEGKIKKNPDNPSADYEENYLQPEGSTVIPPTFKIMIWTIEVEITESVSRKEQFNGFVDSGIYKYGFMFSEYAEGGSLDSLLRPYVFRFYPKVELEKDGQSNPVIITPDNVEDFDAEPLAYVRYNYYNHTEQQNITDINNLKYLYQDKVDWVNPDLKPVYLNYERQATISAKQSNRFNILQTIAEQFKCWVQFVVDHDEDGMILQKKVCIKKGDTTLGANLGYGFVYGIDLKSIKRNIKSNALSTKTIVLQNSNEFGTYGFCAIGRAQDNTSGADYILNFDYYISKGLIDRNQLTIDMYGPEGLYTVLSKNIKPLTEKGALKQSYITEKEKFLALYNMADEGRTSAAKQIESSKERIRSLMRDAPPGDTNFDVAVFNYISKQKAQGGGVSSIQSEYYKYKNAQAEEAKFKTQYEAYGKQISETGIDGKLQQLETEIAAHREVISNAEKKFYESYSRFIQEGTWNDEKYYDDNLYYLDALQVAYTSARPEVSYTIDVFRVGALEEFKGKDFDVGDITFIEDTQYFGYDLVYGVKTPHKEPVYIYEITYYFEEPEKDVVKVQNYKTQFEDLFQRITAETQNLQFAQGSYARAANLLSSSGELNAQKVQEAIQANQKISGNMNNILQDGTGYTVIDKENPNIMTKLTSRGLCSSTDGGVTWTKVVDSGTMPMDALQTGVLNANKNPIVVSYNNSSNNDNRMGFGEVDLSGVSPNDRPQGPIYGLYGNPYLEFYYNAADRYSVNDATLWRIRIDVNDGITFARFYNGDWKNEGYIPVQ